MAAAKRKLESDEDVWLATASMEGEPHLIPLSLSWNGHEVVLATEAQSVTTANVQKSGQVRLALGASRDVVLIQASATVVPCTGAPDELIATFADRTGWNPAADDAEKWVYIVATPSKVQVWRDLPEMHGRTVMKGGRWLDST